MNNYANSYVISCEHDGKWYYAGFKFDDGYNYGEEPIMVFYEGFNDQTFFFTTIKDALDWWNENKGSFDDKSFFNNVAVRKIVFKKKVNLKV